MYTCGVGEMRAKGFLGNTKVANISIALAASALENGKKWKNGEAEEGESLSEALLTRESHFQKDVTGANPLKIMVNMQFVTDYDKKGFINLFDAALRDHLSKEHHQMFRHVMYDAIRGRSIQSGNFRIEWFPLLSALTGLIFFLSLSFAFSSLSLDPYWVSFRF
jgi:hypothetical protein